MSIKHGSNRFFPRAGDGGGGVVPPGAGLWTLYGGTVVGLTDITETVAIGDTAMLSNEKLLVRGGITSGPSGAGSDAFLETGANDASVLSDANSIRIIFNGTSSQAEISTNGGAYVPLASGGASPWVAGGGSITEINPANLVVVGSAAAITGQQFQVLGESFFKPVVDAATVVQVVNAAGSTLFSLDTTDSAVLVGGTTAPAFGSGVLTYQIEVQSDAGGSGMVLRSASAAAGNALLFVQSGGTIAVPTASVNLDPIGAVAFVGYGSDNVLDPFGSVVIQAAVDGAPGLGYVPGRIDVGTKPAGGAGFTTPRFTIRGDGFVGVAQSAAVGTEVFGVTGDAYVGGKLTVTGDIDPISLSLSGSTALYIDSADGSTAPVSGALNGRLRYSNGVPAWQVSVNGGAYSNLITAATLPTTAFVQSGNAFGVTAVLGTTDAQPLTVITSGTEKARFTTAGALLVGATAPVYGELFRVTQSVLGSATSKATAAIAASVTTTDTGGLIGLRVDAAGAINSPDTSGFIQGALIRGVATGTASVAIAGIQSFAGAGPAATGVTISLAYGVNGVIGYDSTAVSGAIASASAFLANNAGLGVGKTIGSAFGLSVSNLGTAQVNSAIGVDVATQTGALVANLGMRSQSPVVIGTAGVSASESLRVSGGGALVDGAIFTVLATGAVSINSSGAAINIGDAANAFAVNVGTGAANRNVTLGSTTGTSQTVVNAGTGGILIGTSASNRTISIGTAAANQQINVGSITGTSSLNFFYGSAGFTTTQANATTGTPVGFAYTAGTHVGLTVAEAVDVNFNLARTVTFGGGGTLALQRAALIQGPTYAAPAALTLTQVATLAVGLPIAGGNVTFTSGATGPTLPTDSGSAGGAYALSVAPGVRIQGDTANATVSVSLLIKNTASNATALPSIGWLSNGGTLDGVMGVQSGNAFNHQRFVLMLRANGTLSPALSISSQGGYRLTNSAPADPATTPAGFLLTGTANGAVNTYAATVEANQFTVNSAQTYTFATGAIAIQRSALFQAPTYAFSAASTINDVATAAITSAPIAGAAASFLRSMAIWVQAGISRFDGGVGVKVTPGGTSVQGLAADFRKTYDPGLVAYAAGTSVALAYSPATGYLSLLPAWWTIPAAILSGGGAGPPLNPGIRFTWSDGTTTDRFNTSTISSLTETRDSIDFNKDGLAIVGLSWIVNNTSGGVASVDFTAWTTDGNQF